MKLTGALQGDTLRRISPRSNNSFSFTSNSFNSGINIRYLFLAIGSVPFFRTMINSILALGGPLRNSYGNHFHKILSTRRSSNPFATPLKFGAMYAYNLYPCMCSLVTVRNNEPRWYSLFCSYNHSSLYFIVGPTQLPHLTVEYCIMRFPWLHVDHVVKRY